VLSGDVADAAVRAARDVAERLTAPTRVEAAAAVARAQTAFPRSTHWIPYTISQGYAGLALLWNALDAAFPDEHWDRVGRDHLELAARGAETFGTPPLGLFSGLSGLAFAAAQSSRQGVRYRRMLAALDAVICPQATACADALSRDQREPDGVTVGDFDVISGLSGVGAYLLCRRDHAEAAAAAVLTTAATASATPAATASAATAAAQAAAPATSLSRVVESLVALAAAREVPRWHTPARLTWDEGMAKVYPHGNLNCGLAHGIPGPLAFLSLASHAGVAMPGLSDAIARLAQWLCDNRCDDGWGINWPTAVPLEAVADAEGTMRLRVGSARDAPDGSSRGAWCYGSPGIARALWLAGEALDRDDYRATAVDAMDAVFRRPIPTRRIDSATFCHGVAGLLQIALRFAHDTSLPRFAEESRTLADQLLESYRPDSLLAFRNLETTGHEIDQPGLLDGAPGVALVLLAAATDVEPSWDRLFLLS
jgi:hypothetical protein